MKLFKEKLLASSAVVTITIVALVGVYHLPLFPDSLKASTDSPYSINLNNDNRIYNQTTFVSAQEVDGNITTNKGNIIEIKSFNIVKNNNGWQTLLPGGYFYNPVTLTGHNNKISGVESVSYQGNGELELHYGWSLNNEEIIYSYEEVLSPNVPFVFDKSPSYIYLKNNGSTNVDIDSFNISYSCSEELYPNNNLKVLMIGNSFADDTVFYTKRVANSYGINIDIHDAYIASCTLNMHNNNLSNNSASYSRRSTNGDNWVYVDNQSLADIINYQTWDVITFQQASAVVGRSDSYTNLSNLISQVRSLAGSHPKFYWYQTWAYDKDYMETNDVFAYFSNNQETMFNAINTCYTNQVSSLLPDMIPGGTAVQNMRTSYMLDHITRDGKHMSSAHGRYLLALNFLSNLYNIDLNLSPCHYLDTGINSSYQDVAYESIRNAHKNPLQITQSAYVNWEMHNYDLSNYVEIDPGLVGNSYYDSLNTEKYAQRRCNDVGISNFYTSTNRFTSTTLPVGSLVFLKEGYGYRPEAWKGDYASSTRPDEAYDNVLEITEDFWDGYAYRAFNIFKVGKTDEYGRFNQIFDSFHIYVPNNKATGLKTKTDNDNYLSDKTIFTNNGVDIDDYQMLHLDPIIGFYKCDDYSDLKNSYVDDTAKKFVCTRPFYMANNDLPVNTVIIVDQYYQWRSDCWESFGQYGNGRPLNVNAQFTKIDSSFLQGLRVRTFNVSSTKSYYVGQDPIGFLNHMRIYIPL